MSHLYHQSKKKKTIKRFRDGWLTPPQHRVITDLENRGAQQYTGKTVKEASDYITLWADDTLIRNNPYGQTH